jgi:ProP effector
LDGKLTLKSELKPLSPKKERYKRYIATCKTVIHWLREKYPLCFSKENPLPLKIGIIKDIFAVLPPDISRLSVRKALARYTKSPEYKQALKTCPHRYDLNGNEAGIVSEEHKSAA